MEYAESNRLEAMLERLGDKVDRNAEEIGKLVVKVESLNKLLAGNGSTGVVTRQALVLAELERGKQHRAEIEAELKAACTSIQELQNVRQRMYGAAAAFGLGGSAIGALVGRLLLP